MCLKTFFLFGDLVYWIKPACSKYSRENLVCLSVRIVLPRLDWENCMDMRAFVGCLVNTYYFLFCCFLGQGGFDFLFYFKVIIRICRNNKSDFKSKNWSKKKKKKPCCLKGKQSLGQRPKPSAGARRRPLSRLSSYMHFLKVMNK